MIYREPLISRIEDFTPEWDYTASAILKALENIADKHHSIVAAEEGTAELPPGYVWLLKEWRVEIPRTPTRDDKLTLETWVMDTGSGPRTTREVHIVDDSGAVFAKAHIQFSAYNPAEHKKLTLSNTYIPRYSTEEKGVFDGELPRLTMPKSFESERKISVRRADIDYNNHVHNVAYLDYALEMLSDSEAQSRSIAGYRIDYFHSLKYGDEVTLRRVSGAGYVKVGMYSGGRLACIVKFDIKTH